MRWPQDSAMMRRDASLERARRITLWVAGGATAASLVLATALGYALPGHAAPTGSQSAQTGSGSAGAGQGTSSGSAGGGTNGGGGQVAPPQQPPSGSSAPPAVSSGGS